MSGATGWAGVFLKLNCHVTCDFGLYFGEGRRQWNFYFLFGEFMRMGMRDRMDMVMK